MDDLSADHVEAAIDEEVARLMAMVPRSESTDVSKRALREILDEPYPDDFEHPLVRQWLDRRAEWLRANDNAWRDRFTSAVKKISRRTRYQRKNTPTSIDWLMIQVAEAAADRLPQWKVSTLSSIHKWDQRVEQWRLWARRYDWYATDGAKSNSLITWFGIATSHARQYWLSWQQTYLLLRLCRIHSTGNFDTIIASLGNVPIAQTDGRGAIEARAKNWLKAVTQPRIDGQRFGNGPLDMEATRKRIAASLDEDEKLLAAKRRLFETWLASQTT
jgi:hypothetical protein